MQKPCRCITRIALSLLHHPATSPLALFTRAMAHSKPVIGCKVGGVPEVVVDGSNGLLIEPDNSDALTNVILDLLGSEEKLKRFGEAGRQRSKGFLAEKRCVETQLICTSNNPASRKG